MVMCKSKTHTRPHLPSVVRMLFEKLCGRDYFLILSAYCLGGLGYFKCNNVDFLGSDCGFCIQFLFNILPYPTPFLVGAG